MEQKPFCEIVRNDLLINYLPWTFCIRDIPYPLCNSTHPFLFYMDITSTTRIVYLSFRVRPMHFYIYNVFTVGFNLSFFSHHMVVSIKKEEYKLKYQRRESDIFTISCTDLIRIFYISERFNTQPPRFPVCVLCFLDYIGKVFDAHVSDPIIWDKSSISMCFTHTSMAVSTVEQHYEEE